MDVFGQFLCRQWTWVWKTRKWTRCCKVLLIEAPVGVVLVVQVQSMLETVPWTL